MEVFKLERKMKLLNIQLHVIWEYVMLCVSTEIYMLPHPGLTRCTNLIGTLFYGKEVEGHNFKRIQKEEFS